MNRSSKGQKFNAGANRNFCEFRNLEPLNSRYCGLGLTHGLASRL